MSGDNLMTHKIQITFTEEQWNLIQEVKGHMGKSDAETARNIIISWLAEKSIVSTTVKKDLGSSLEKEK